jgi:hypothetical protein
MGGKIAHYCHLEKYRIQTCEKKMILAVFQKKLATLIKTQEIHQFSYLQ